MKKLLVVLTFLMGIFTVPAQSAEVVWGETSLDWGTITGTSANWLQGGTSRALFGGDSGLNKGESVAANWEFLLGAISNITIKISSIDRNPTWLSWVTLDGAGLTQIDENGNPVAAGASTNGQWLFTGILDQGYHVLSLSGTTNAGNSGYLMNVNAEVPAPAAVWLFGSALVGLGGFKRRKA